MSLSVKRETSMKDSILLMDIYKRYLDVTGDLVTILERNYQQIKSDEDENINEKRHEFIQHAHNAISSFHNDLHILFRLSWELKDLESEE